MNPIKHGQVVVYQIALNEHPLIADPDDDRSDAELVEAVEAWTNTTGGLDLPPWTVFESTAPGEGGSRYVSLMGRINVRAVHGAVDPFEEVADRFTINGFDIGEAAMSYVGPVRECDFNNVVHLDLVDDDYEYGYE